MLRGLGLPALFLAGLGAGAMLPAATPEPAAPWTIPPLDGELEGDFRPLTVPDAPVLHWRLQVRTQPSRQRTGEVAIEGPGTRVAAAIEVDRGGRGTWRVADAQVNLATWSRAVLAMFGPEFAQSSMGGSLALSGEGRLGGGEIAGSARLVLRDGRLDDPANKVLLEGITLEFVVDDLAGRRSRPAQVLSWTGGSYSSIRLGAGHVVFSLRGEEVQVDEATVSVFGGQLRLAAFSFSTARREASVIARVVGLDLAQLVPLLPPVLAAARGRVDGSIALHRTPDGLQIGMGNLALRAGESADLRLAPSPGLLSSSLPEAVLKYYPGIGKIETGEVPLRADHLDVTFTPAGDAQGRTAAIRIAGGPIDPSLRAPVDLNINVRGPLESLIKFSTDSRLRFGSGKP